MKFFWPFSKHNDPIEDSIRSITNTGCNIKLSKEIYKKNKAHIDTWSQNFNNEQQRLCKEYMNTKSKEYELHNSVCPICGNTAIVTNFLNDKEKNIVKFNHCNSCNHEWERKEFDRNGWYDGCIRLEWEISRFIDHVYIDLYKFCWDPSDITSDYDTKEEAWEGELNNIRNRYSWIIENLDMCLLNYYTRLYRWRLMYENEILGNYNSDDNSSEYVGRFPKDFEKILLELGIKDNW